MALRIKNATEAEIPIPLVRAARCDEPLQAVCCVLYRSCCVQVAKAIARLVATGEEAEGEGRGREQIRPEGRSPQAEECASAGVLPLDVLLTETEADTVYDLSQLPFECPRDQLAAIRSCMVCLVAAAATGHAGGADLLSELLGRALNRCHARRLGERPLTYAAPSAPLMPSCAAQICHLMQLSYHYSAYRRGDTLELPTATAQRLALKIEHVTRATWRQVRLTLHMHQLAGMG